LDRITSLNHEILRSLSEQKRLIDRLHIAQLKGDDAKCDIIYQQLSSVNDIIENLRVLKEQVKETA
jgi:hypothetical protein